MAMGFENFCQNQLRQKKREFQFYIFSFLLKKQEQILNKK